MHVAKFVCPTSQLLKHPAKSAFKRLILTTPLRQHLLLTMSTNPMSVELNDSECEKGQVTQQHPIPYAASKSSLIMMTTRGTVKMKTPEGDLHKQAILGNGADREEYVEHLMSFDQLMEKKGYRADLADAAKAVLKVGLTLKKHTKVPKEENDPEKAVRLTKVKAAERELSAAKVVESTVACLAYDLFCKLTKDNPEIQWDRIVADMHTQNLWLDIRGVKHQGLCEKSNQSLINCIEQHKLTFFACDSVERLKYYMMCSIKKPVRLTIRQHVCRMKTLNKYLGILPTIKNSPMAVASAELGNVPFTEATHASIILSHLPVVWRN